MPTRNPYASNLSDDEWEILLPLVPKAKPGGRPRAHQSRELLNAIFFYVLRGGCAWSLLPPRLLLTLADRLPLLQGVARRWHLGADAHRPAREVAPLAGQGAYPERGDHRLPETAKTTEKGGVRGYDGGKKISGRKRHLLVDTQGLVIGVAVHAANIADRDGAKLLLALACSCLRGSAKGWREWRRCGPIGVRTAR